MTDVQPSAGRRRGMFEKAIARLFMRKATIVARRTIAADFHLIELAGPDLRKVAWLAGQKVQILTGSLASRTYTPIEWNSETGHTSILAYTHGAGPGSDWMRAAQVGAECHFAGPRASLNLKDVAGPKVIFGDETSFGLALSALGATASPTRCLFEVSALDQAQGALSAMGIKDARLFERCREDAHLDMIEPLLAELAASGTTFILTGKAGSAQRLRQALKPLHVPAARILTKAYWAPGKTGLD